MWTEFIWVGMGSTKYGIEPQGSINVGNCLRVMQQLRAYGQGVCYKEVVGYVL